MSMIVLGFRHVEVTARTHPAATPVCPVKHPLENCDIVAANAGDPESSNGPPALVNVLQSLHLKGVSPRMRLIHKLALLPFIAARKWTQNKALRLLTTGGFGFTNINNSGQPRNGQLVGLFTF